MKKNVFRLSGRKKCPKLHRGALSDTDTTYFKVGIGIFKFLRFPWDKYCERASNVSRGWRAAM